MASSPQPQKRIKLLFTEILAGLCTGFAVSPLNVVIDKSVIEHTSGQGKMLTLASQNLTTIVKNPIAFLSGFSFRWMYFVYSFTYASSNLADHINLTSQVSHPIQKLAIVFVVNTTCGIIKDKKYAVGFGRNIGRIFPPISYGMFFLRDLTAIAAAFTIPPMLGRFIAQRMNVSPQNGHRIGQLTSPLCAQFITTIWHLLGLDIYNRPGLNLAERFKYIKGIYIKSLLMRMMRNLPAYRIGGIINIELRRFLKGESIHH